MGSNVNAYCLLVSYFAIDPSLPPAAIPPDCRLAGHPSAHASMVPSGRPEVKRIHFARL